MVNKTRHWAKFILNTGIALTSLAVSLLVSEWFVRTYMPCPDYGGGKRPALYSHLFEYDEQLGWKGVPNIRTPYYSKDFKVTISHDALGYRNIYPPYVAGKANYLLLGDSYGWGWGVEDNETAAAVFNQRHSDINIYSLGIPGYGTDQEYLAMQKFLAERKDQKYKGVILLFYYNDFENNGLAESYLYPKPFFSLDENNVLSLNNIPVPKKDIPQDKPVTLIPVQDDPLRKYQLLTLTLDGLVRSIGFITSIGEPEPEKIPVKISDWEKKNQAITAAVIRQMQTTCLMAGMDFHVVFLMTQNTDEHPGTMITGLARELDSSHIDYSFFYSRKFPRTDLWLDTHYTPYGQALLAEHIAGVIAHQQHSP